MESANAFIRESDPELWESMEPFTLEEAESVLGVIQGFYPSGVGARDLRETLLIQLRDRGEQGTLAYRIVHDHFEQLVNHRWSELSKEHGISPKDVQAPPTRSPSSTRSRASSTRT